MSRKPAIAVILLILALTVASLVPRGEVTSFQTPQCRASQLIEVRTPFSPQLPKWRPPETLPTRLASRPGTIHGAAPEPSPPLLEFKSSQLAGWRPSTFSGGEIGWRSPVIEVDLSTASSMRITLVPGNAVHLELTTSFEPELDRRQRGLRTMAFQLDGTTPDTPITLEVPVNELVGGNWDDDRHPGRRLRRLELRVPNAYEAEGLVFSHIEILGSDAPYAGQSAGQRTLEADGVLRPGWFVRGGASVTLDDEVGAGQLTVYLAAVGEVRATLQVGDKQLAFAPGESWSPHRIDVDGGKITLSAEGDGIVLFGNPMLQIQDAAEQSPNILVVLADTLRADHLGAWGARTVISPNIDALADEGSTFGLAQSTASWTKPAIPTLMTGIWATTHQVGAHSYADRLPPSVPTLQGVLASQGWRTGSFSASPLGSTLSGLERGFDVAVAPRHWAGQGGALGHASLDDLSVALFDWWDDGTGPVFAYLHAMEVHAWRRGPYKRRPNNPHTSYELAIADFDAKMARLRSELESRGELDNTLIVLTSDHGEAFGDHGESDHGTSLYQSQIHIPLVFWAEQLPSSWSADPVSLADIAPTILDLVGANALSEADGASLVPAIRTGEAVHDFVPSARERFVWRYTDEPIYAITTASRMKWVNKVGGYSHFFDLNADLCEAKTTTWPSRFARQTLEAWVQDQKTAREAFAKRHPAELHDVRADDVRMLEEMGYLDGSD